MGMNPSQTRQRMPSWMTHGYLTATYDQRVISLRMCVRHALVLVERFIVWWAEEEVPTDEECSWLQVLVVFDWKNHHHLHQLPTHCKSQDAIIFLIDSIFLCKEISNNNGQQKGSGETKMDESIQKKRHVDSPSVLFQR